ncbi:MAG: hypothetical protein LBQ91_05155, partial [Oscillospiraceae bacterium]|nr:hypothetical protein [Oscillospiraceae bacterium]
PAARFPYKRTPVTRSTGKRKSLKTSTPQPNTYTPLQTTRADCYGEQAPHNGKQNPNRKAFPKYFLLTSTPSRRIITSIK